MPSQSTSLSPASVMRQDNAGPDSPPEDSPEAVLRGRLSPEQEVSSLCAGRTATQTVGAATQVNQSSLLLLKTRSSPSDSYEEYFRKWSEQAQSRARDRQRRRDTRLGQGTLRRGDEDDRSAQRNSVINRDHASRRVCDGSAGTEVDPHTADSSHCGGEIGFGEESRPDRKLRTAPGSSEEARPCETEGIRIKSPGCVQEGSPLKALPDRNPFLPDPVRLAPDPKAPPPTDEEEGTRRGGMDGAQSSGSRDEQTIDHNRHTFPTLPCDPWDPAASQMGVEEIVSTSIESGHAAGQEVSIRKGDGGALEESTGMKNATEQLENRAPDCDESDSTEMAEEAWDVRFCPVLTTTFDREAMEGVARLVTHEGGEDTEAIDGLILTSQRAAEALLSLLPSSTSELEALLNSAAGSRLTTLQKLARGSFPIFVIGPATYRLLASHPLILQSSLLGRETGNGASLAAFVLKYYETLDSQSPDQGSRKSDLGVNCSQQNRRRTLLFPTGDPHRDIIPKSLSSPDLPTERRLNVIEETVYRTVEDSTFAGRFARLIDDVSRSDQRADVSAPCLDRYQPQPCLWVVVFSPQGCAAMIRHLRANALLPSASPTARRPDNETESEPLVRIRVATIGPTTAEYLRTECDFEPDVVADTPSPAGIRQGIEAWRANTARSKVGARSRHE